MSNERQSLAGTWPARAVSWDLGFAKSTGNEQISILFKITEGPHEGKTKQADLSFAGGALDITLRAMRNCGWDSDTLAELDSLGNNEVELVIEDERYTADNGEERWNSKVKWVNRRSVLMISRPMNDAQKAAFAARLMGKTVASKQKHGAQPSQSAQRPQQSFGGARPQQRDENYGPDAPFGDDDSGLPF